MRVNNMRREQGFTLFIALTMLALMTIIGVALVRAVDTTNEVADNIGFVQSTLISTESGLEAATQWLVNNSNLLSDGNREDEGYYVTDVDRATALAGGQVDYTGSATPGDSNDDVDWEGVGNGIHKAKKLPGLDGAGNQVAYIIHRLCDSGGSPGTPGIGCARMETASSLGGSKSGISYGSTVLKGRTRIYYRITVRAKGPRNTASYTQSTIVLEY